MNQFCGTRKRTVDANSEITIPAKFELSSQGSM